MGEARGVGTEEPERCPVVTSYPGDTAYASQPLWQSAGEGSVAEGVRGTGKPEESGRGSFAALDAGKRLKRLQRRKFIPTTDSRHGLAVCENILGRMFHAEAGGQKWVSDTTS
jgi:hypothetical protein